MPGLLDFMDDPQVQFGLQMLGGQGNAAQRALQALGLFQQQDEAKFKRKLGQAQLDDIQAQARGRDAATAKQADLLETLRNLGAGAPNANPGQVSTPTVGGQPFFSQGSTVGQTQQPTGGWLTGMPLETIAMLKAKGADFTKEWELANVGTNAPANSYRLRPNQPAEYLTDPKTGVDFKNGQINMLPGAENLAAVAGQQTDAQEAGKAKYDLTTYTPAGGPPTMTTRANLVRNMGAPPTGAAPTPPAGYSGGSAAAAAPEQLQIMQSELDNPATSAADKQGIQREMARLRQQMTSLGGGGIALQSDAEKARSVGQATADIQPTEGRQNAVASGQYLLNILDQAGSHPGRTTATGLSSVLDPRNYIPGTNAKDFQSLLDQIKGSAFLQAYNTLKGGGAITDVEGAKATNALARLNTSQSDDQFASSLKEFRDIVQNGLTRAKTAAGRAGTAIDPNASNQDVGAQPKTWKDFYPSQDAALQDARNVLMKNPSARPEVLRRLNAMGLQLGGQ